MIGSPQFYAGTGGHSMWFSLDRGENWVRPNSHSGLYLEASIWTIASHPAIPETLLDSHTVPDGGHLVSHLRP